METLMTPSQQIWKSILLALHGQVDPQLGSSTAIHSKTAEKSVEQLIAENPNGEKQKAKQASRFIF